MSPKRSKEKPKGHILDLILIVLYEYSSWLFLGRDQKWVSSGKAVIIGKPFELSEPTYLLTFRETWSKCFSLIFYYSKLGHIELKLPYQP